MICDRNMKHVVLIGSNGQLGTDIISVFSKDKTLKLTKLTREKLDITNPEQVTKVITKLKPDVVINTAAYHKVDEMEDNEEQSFLVNCMAQKNLSEATAAAGAAIVFISTDYVYGHDMKRTKPFKETDAPDPVNIYGVSKTAGEYVTRYSNKKHFVVRVAGLYGVAGSAGKGGNFVELMIRLGRERGWVEVVTDQVTTPTYTRNIAENLNALIKTTKYGVYHMTSEGCCNWWEFAQEIFKQTKMEVECKKTTSKNFKTRAVRPAFSVLENASLKRIKKNTMNHWKKSLTLYLKEKKYI